MQDVLRGRRFFNRPFEAVSRASCPLCKLEKRDLKVSIRNLVGWKEHHEHRQKDVIFRTYGRVADAADVIPDMLSFPGACSNTEIIRYAYSQPS